MHNRKPNIFLDSIQTKSSLLPYCGSFRDRSIRSDEPEIWDFVHNCIEKCNTEHTPCDISKLPTKLPKRVLDLGSESGHIRIWETQPEETATYAALSHCWGSGSPLRTLTENLQQMKTKILTEDLNSTFKDAIRVCRALKLRYLWIDSLCIIQDSPEDWEEQASLMSSIYKNAYVTIATGSSSGPHESIFAERDDTWQSWVTRLGSDEISEQVRVRLKVLPVIDSVERNSYSSKGSLSNASSRKIHSALDYQWDGPLYCRAWCFQEQFLSRRMIHFAPGAVIWECQIERHVEGEEAVQIPSNNQPTFAQNDVGRQWQDAVKHYTHRDITYSSDRLIALSGIASDTARLRNDQYLAGLWKSSIFWDLLWYPNVWVQKPIPDKYISPSWSWPSLGGPVVWSNYPEDTVLKTYVEVQGAETSLKSTLNPFGDVTSGSVTLRGPTVQAVLNMDEDMARGGQVHVTGHWEKEGRGHYVLPDVRLYEADGLLADGSTEKTYRRALPGEEYARHWDEESELFTYRMQVAIICFLHCKTADVVGLVLGRSTTVPGAFTRLACVRMLPTDFLKKAKTDTITIV